MIALNLFAGYTRRIPVAALLARPGRALVRSAHSERHVRECYFVKLGQTRSGYESLIFPFVAGEISIVF